MKAALHEPERRDAGRIAKSTAGRQPAVDDDNSGKRADRAGQPARPVESAAATTPEKALIRRVLLNICSIPLFGGVGMMFMLH